MGLIKTYMKTHRKYKKQYLKSILALIIGFFITLAIMEITIFIMDKYNIVYSGEVILHIYITLWAIITAMPIFIVNIGTIEVFNETCINRKVPKQIIYTMVNTLQVITICLYCIIIANGIVLVQYSLRIIN